MLSTPAVTLPSPAAASLVTVTPRLDPVGAVDDTVMVAVMVVEVIVTTVKMTPFGLVTLAPVANPFPEIVTGVVVFRATHPANGGQTATGANSPITVAGLTIGNKEFDAELGTELWGAVWEQLLLAIG